MDLTLLTIQVLSTVHPTISANQDAEVSERGKGRVFFASTDQDGFFRVGKFFSVDQGTGTVTFSGKYCY